MNWEYTEVGRSMTQKYKIQSTTLKFFSELRARTISQGNNALAQRKKQLRPQLRFVER